MVTADVSPCYSSRLLVELGYTKLVGFWNNIIVTIVPIQSAGFDSGYGRKQSYC